MRKFTRILMHAQAKMPQISTSSIQFAILRHQATNFAGRNTKK